ncbi:MAG TPA: SDR family oxidoreductase [Steroidobacteraceae bacterium]|nr:SDR family oxidoreductase [Steroidobacteraceae bacterium]
MSYFVTGATGFIGRHLVAELLTRGATIHILLRPGSRGKLEALLREWGTEAHRIVPVEGDLSLPLLGVSPVTRARLRDTVGHVFHLAALYDLAADEDALERSNVVGTRNALDFAHDIGAGCFHLVSSIASAGCYPGTFTEDMFAEARGLAHPYFRTKHESERIVREESRIAWRVYRPAMVIGHSQTGVMDKIDGPYYFFKLIQRVRDLVPRWVPLLGFEGGHINLVPVDFVARALAHLAHVPGHDGRCFHLVDPIDRRVGEVLNVFANAAHAPTMTLRLEPSLLQALPAVTDALAAAAAPLRRMRDAVLADLHIPESVLELLNYPTTFDASRTWALLREAGIELPKLEDYAWRLWDYWERHLDPDLRRDRSLRGAVQGRKVLITGGSSGIGRATALKLADAGAHVLIVARDPEKLSRAAAEIESSGGRVSAYVCDICDTPACETFIARVLSEHGYIDVLINNAGHSIRRAIENTYQRFHDYERLMRINYFAAVRVTLGFLPAMVKRRAGHVISISSIGVLSDAPRFAGYNASKAALEAFTRCAGAEFSDRGVSFTVVNMPLVRTPMVAPTKIYEQFALLQPEEAASLVCDAVIHKPQRLATPLGNFAQLLGVLAPRVSELLMSESFKMYPESEAAGAPPGSDRRASPEMIAFAALMRGVHW